MSILSLKIKKGRWRISKFLNFLEKSKDKLENIEFEEVRFTHEVLDIICKMKNLKRLAIKRNLIFSNFIEGQTE